MPANFAISNPAAPPLQRKYGGSLSYAVNIATRYSVAIKRRGSVESAFVKECNLVWDVLSNTRIVYKSGSGVLLLATAYNTSGL